MISTSAPLLGRRAAPSVNVTDIVHSTGQWARKQVRAARLAERIELDHLVAEHFGDVADEAAEVAADAEIEAMYAAEADYRGCGPYCDLCTAERNDDEFNESLLLDDMGCRTFLDLARLVIVDQAAAYNLDEDDLPGWGENFDPEEVQWGFTVRRRF